MLGCKALLQFPKASVRTRDNGITAMEQQEQQVNNNSNNNNTTNTTTTDTNNNTTKVIIVTIIIIIIIMIRIMIIIILVISTTYAETCTDGAISSTNIYIHTHTQAYRIDCIGGKEVQISFNNKAVPVSPLLRNRWCWRRNRIVWR